MGKLGPKSQVHGRLSIGRVMHFAALAALGEQLTVLPQTPWLDLGEGNKEGGMERAMKGKEMEEEGKEREKGRGNGNWGRSLHH